MGSRFYIYGIGMGLDDECESGLASLHQRDRYGFR